MPHEHSHYLQDGLPEVFQTILAKHSAKPHLTASVQAGRFTAHWYAA
jgi:hypothetical protein